MFFNLRPPVLNPQDLATLPVACPQECVYSFDGELRQTFRLECRHASSMALLAVTQERFRFQVDSVQRLTAELTHLESTFTDHFP